MKLTGLQGDVMKESMNVAKSLAWSLLTNKRQTNQNELKKHLHNLYMFIVQKVQYLKMVQVQELLLQLLCIVYFLEKK